MNLLFVQKSVTRADVFDSSIGIEPSIVNFPIGISERFTHIL